MELGLAAADPDAASSAERTMQLEKYRRIMCNTYRLLNYLRHNIRVVGQLVRVLGDHVVSRVHHLLNRMEDGLGRIHHVLNMSFIPCLYRVLQN